MKREQKQVQQPAILQFRTTEAVRQALRERAAADDRSVNFILHKLVESALGLEKAA